MKIQANHLRTFVRSIFVAAGCSDAESARIAKHLVEANLVGHDSHGVIRVPRYVTWLKEGALHADQDVTVVMENDAIAREILYHSRNIIFFVIVVAYDK